MSELKDKFVKIGSRFLEEMDNFIKENWQNLTCNDVYHMYFDFVGISNGDKEKISPLKQFKGNSNGFTGLSELIILRFLINQLGGACDKDWTKDTRCFISKSNEKLRIIPEPKVESAKPDIAIYKSNELVGVIEVKVYFTYGVKTVNTALEKLENIHNFHRGMRALLIVFCKISKKRKSNVLETLQGLKNKLNKEKEWFNYLVLEEKGELFRDEIEKGLDLTTITSA